MTYLEMLKNSYNEFINSNPKEKILRGDLIGRDCITIDKEVSNENKYKIHTDLIPQPIFGNINKAKIVFCSLNPGYSILDYAMENIEQAKENKVPFYKKQLINFLNQDLDNSFIFFKEENIFSPVYSWWDNLFDAKNKSKSLVHRILNNYNANGINIDKKQLYNMLSNIICTIELFPYHSSKCNKSFIKNMESVKLVKEFVHDELIPNSINNNMLICFSRSISEWELTDKEMNSINVNINNVNRNRITLNPYLSYGKRIYEHLKTLTNNFTVLLK